MGTERGVRSLPLSNTHQDRFLGGAHSLDNDLGADETRQQLDHLLANSVQFSAELLKDLSSDTLPLPEKSKKDVLRADVVVTELLGLSKREFQDLLGPGRERDVAWVGGLAPSDDLFHLPAHRFQRDTQRCERLCPDVLSFMKKPEQEMLCADVVVVQLARFCLGKNNDPTGPIREPFEHCALG